MSQEVTAIVLLETAQAISQTVPEADAIMVRETVHDLRNSPLSAELTPADRDLFYAAETLLNFGEIALRSLTRTPDDEYVPDHHAHRETRRLFDELSPFSGPDFLLVPSQTGPHPNAVLESLKEYLFKEVTTEYYEKSMMGAVVLAGYTAEPFSVEAASERLQQAHTTVRTVHSEIS